MGRPITLEAAKARYVNRYTMEHIPTYMRKACEGNGRYYAPQYRTDSEWFELTRFPGEDGLSARSDHCESLAQTWPLGQWLGAPLDPRAARVAARDDKALAALREAVEPPRVQIAVLDKGASRWKLYAHGAAHDWREADEAKARILARGGAVQFLTVPKESK